MTVENRDCFFPFLIYYANKASFDVLNRYKVVVLEPDFYTDVYAIHTTALAYLSVGEVHPTRAYFKELQKSDLLLKSHQFYDSHYLSLRSEIWQDYIIEIVIPDFVEKGFKGVMLDTVDSLLLNHSSEDVINFINRLKWKFPELYFIQNRGFAIMERTDVDAFLVESTLSSPDSSGCFTVIDFVEYKRVVHKEYFSVDYWDLEDQNGVAAIYERAHALGYTPFVSSRCLTWLPPYAQKNEVESNFSNRAVKNMEDIFKKQSPTLL